MRNSVITLLTDFGTKDHYVASMKGVILSMNPRCTLIDITHQVSPQNIKEGAFLLALSYSYFPKGTIHLCVIDPGVGGARKPILLVTQNYFFVGPDNGLFSLVAQREKVKQVIVLTQSKYFLSKLSQTFHGRDLFAPVAAHLSLGIPPSAFGYPTHSWVKVLFGKPVIRDQKLLGEFLHIDSFGNLISNIDERLFSTFTKGHPVTIQVGKKKLHTLRKGYWEGKPGEPIGLFGSTGFLEISIREGNAHKTLNLRRGDPIIVSRISQS
ncbi:MAG: SAM-dependent chlorinase/fluorinase [Syntrophaceae bacterium]|nr:SAM-dependent chlorinase/fluorinase [Syntrophaceae bacterium]